MKVAVIGSGPSGWAAYEKLRQLGHDVWILDAGLNASSENKIPVRSSKQGLTHKLYFGSDLPYRDYPFGPKRFSNGVNPISSFASGGLSLVWGATMLPYCEADMKDWPIAFEELERHYSEIVNQIPVCGNQDGLSDIYGDFFSRRGAFQSERIVRFLERMSLNAPQQAVYGSSRLAVETGTQIQPGCNYCGLCLSGCPGGFIWSTQNSFCLAKVIQLRVLRLIDSGRFVQVFGLDYEGNEISDLTFEKIFIAAGPVESFRILANSSIVPKRVLLKDSATFFLPLFASPSLGRWRRDHLALSQSFVKIKHANSDLHSQFQLYEYSENLISRARKAIPFGTFLPKFFLHFFLRRMVVAIGYLDSSISPQIEMSLTEDGNLKLAIASKGVLIGERNTSIRQAILNFKKALTNSGLLPISFLTQFAAPGEGVHFGAWLPMGVSSDLTGRPTGCVNVHVVDSSVLPSIAPGPITFTVMANAMRIVEEACL